MTELAERLSRHVHRLAGAIGARNLWTPAALGAAAAYIEAELSACGCAPRRQAFTAGGLEVANVEAEYPGRGRPPAIVVIGAHYDTAGQSPGADDNASGVAALLELARVRRDAPAGRASIRFVAFVNEEPPHFMTETMGSLVYARAAARRGDRIRAMLSLESIGYFADGPGTQRYPAPFSWFLPDRGNFLAMVSNFRSIPLLRSARSAFRRATPLPLIASPAPESIPGVSWSDHSPFWKHGYRALMLTDTAPFRYPHYHLTTDTPDRVDCERLAEVVRGVDAIIERLGRS
jgi:Zn-dependent M28 family amino/carboxypeptidase